MGLPVKGTLYFNRIDDITSTQPEMHNDTSVYMILGVYCLMLLIFLVRFVLLCFLFWNVSLHIPLLCVLSVDFPMAPLHTPNEPQGGAVQMGAPALWLHSQGLCSLLPTPTVPALETTPHTTLRTIPKTLPPPPPPPPHCPSSRHTLRTLQ